MRLIVVSNRLPLTATRNQDRLEFAPSAGGLVSGLSSYLDSLRGSSLPQVDYVWAGWPGISVPEGERPELKARLASELQAQPIFLAEEVMDKFYHGFCNETIWPLFHYFPSLTLVDDACWQSYQEVNAAFCEGVLEIARPDDVIWVHDYHLMLLPKMLRARMPDATIGFFLHIPFPSFEIFRILPKKYGVQILEGLIGADLIGFHTHDYSQYFLRCLMRLLGYEHDLGVVTAGERIVKVDTFPMGIDYARFARSAANPEVAGEKKKLDSQLCGYKVILSIDRLDYSKGILNRLEGYELLLEKYPQWRRRTVLLIVVVPSRIQVGEYRRMKHRIDELIGKINGRYGAFDWTPILYQYRNLAFAPLVALYRLSDVALITPLRDGMNLVAKEYVASRPEGKGVLVLSELAGCAKELSEALTVNPYSRDEIAEALACALDMPETEQARRNTVMQTRLRHYDVVRWAGDFLADLAAVKGDQIQFRARLLDTRNRGRLLQSFHSASRRMIFLDYDGTLVPFAESPLRAVPDEALLRTLHAISTVNHVEVTIISGRDRTTLRTWFERLDINLVAEHGMWIKEKGADWRLMKPLGVEWKPKILTLLKLHADRVPGSFVEEKETSLAWHYRRADPELGPLRAKELAYDLVEFVANMDLQVIQGNRVVEIRAAGVHKGTAAAWFLEKGLFDFVFAAGDDFTDEDLFRILPTHAYSVRVGMVSSQAKFNLRDYRELRALLDEMSR